MPLFAVSNVMFVDGHIMLYLSSVIAFALNVPGAPPSAAAELKPNCVPTYSFVGEPSCVT